ncbi:unnamed protein product, partial [Ectocarpus sp. 12 AP-2014]
HVQRQSVSEKARQQHLVARKNAVVNLPHFDRLDYIADHWHLFERCVGSAAPALVVVLAEALWRAEENRSENMCRAVVIEAPVAMRTTREKAAEAKPKEASVCINRTNSAGHLPEAGQAPEIATAA